MMPFVLLLIYLSAATFFSVLPVCCASHRIRTIIEYIDQDGRQAVFDAADRASVNAGGSGSGESDGIVVDAGRFHFLAADLAEDDVKLLRNNPHIRSVERDEEYPVFGAVPLDNYAVGDNSEDGGAPGQDHNDAYYQQRRRRKVAEMMPEAVTIIQANQLSLGPDPPLVCVADSGYALGHPDLPQPPMVNGTDMDMPDGRILRWYEDSSGHGTESAGIIAAIEGNGVGMRGASPGVNLYITRGLDDDKRSTVSQMLRSIQQCVDAGARIINLSLGCPCYDPDGSCMDTRCYSKDIERYFAHVAASGIMIVAAAGNQGDPVSFYPASYPDVISVGAANRRLGKFGQSNMNDQVELMGLGYAVRTLSVTNRTEYELDAVTSGTSVATSSVVAAAALLWSHYPECNGTHLRTALGRTAINADGCNDHTGFGLVQVKDAYDVLLKEGCEQDGRLFFGDEVSCHAQFLQTYDPTTSPTMIPTSINPTPAPTGDLPSNMPSAMPSTKHPTEFPTEEVTADSGGVIVDLPFPSPSPTQSSSELSTDLSADLSTDLSTDVSTDLSTEESTTSNASITTSLWRPLPTLLLILFQAGALLY